MSLVDRIIEGLSEGPATLSELVERIGADDAGPVLRALQSQIELKTVKCSGAPGGTQWFLPGDAPRIQDTPTKAPAPLRVAIVRGAPSERILEHLRMSLQPMACRTIAETLDLTEPNCYAALCGLVKSGKIAAIGSGRGKKYASHGAAKLAEHAQGESVEATLAPESAPESPAPVAASAPTRSGTLWPIVALLESLPPTGTHLPPRRRKALNDALTALVDFLYPEAA